MSRSEEEELTTWMLQHKASCQCEILPPVTILRSPDLLAELWGWNRLLAYDLDCEIRDPSIMLRYESYLEAFYIENTLTDAGDMISRCLEKEKTLSSFWKAKRIKVISFELGLSIEIQECMSDIMHEASIESKRPFLIYAAACITKEAELMIEWLNQESFVPLEEYTISCEIRQLALDLAMVEGDWSVHTAAALGVLLGITKEAASLLKNAKLGSFVSTDISMRIRTYGLNFLIDALNEYESHAKLTSEVSDEMTSAIEENQLTWCRTENSSFGKEMQEQFISKNIIFAKRRPEDIICEEYPLILSDEDEDEESEQYPICEVMLEAGAERADPARGLGVLEPPPTPMQPMERPEKLPLHFLAMDEDQGEKNEGEG